ncbi:hypothetical protein CCACVL1_03959 [Corchorus capsularis]|uniref:Uncharacterized protein n=1 Tax=Corchorus capsularis TaxID=210143 RepID=A0A1R3JWH9_COCAP|nr:hypothetical protein CCACVL1_03959 [Corchorus capsularis]
MSNLAKLEFVALDILGKNYLSWILDAKIHLDARGLGDTIKENNEASNQDRAKAMIFLRHHLHEGLKAEYLTVKDPLVLWNNLKERYDHQKTVILPKARYEWMHLRLQDFKSQQFREKGFKKYSELISCLLVAEQNNELLMKNHESRPTGSAPFPEVNVATHKNYNYGCGRGCGRGFGHGRGRDRSSGYNGDHLKNRGRSYGYNGDHSKNISFHPKWRGNELKNEKEKEGSPNLETIGEASRGSDTRWHAGARAWLAPTPPGHPCQWLVRPGRWPQAPCRQCPCVGWVACPTGAGCPCRKPDAPPSLSQDPCDPVLVRHLTCLLALKLNFTLLFQTFENQSYDDKIDSSSSSITIILAPFFIQIVLGKYLFGQVSIANESKPHLKHGRPVGSKDKNPRKRKGAKNQDGQIEDMVTPEEYTHEEFTPEKSIGIINNSVPEEHQVPDNCEVPQKASY